MTSGDRPGKGIIAGRLDRLFESVQPLGRAYTLREVVEGINGQAGQHLLSVQYLSQLRNGDRSKPSYDVLTAISKWFGVQVTYFSDDEVFQRTEEELRVLGLMQDNGVRNLAFRAAGISEQSLALVTALVEKMRLAEGLTSDAPGDAGGQSR
jgi:transcriptional regulator with XRE-family HTH domain